eukprot:TRINITY_DN24453_c0_g1_i1.p1 TRINITY_DN24453_c0_g1~~TRINITY_DN24453_c0_g1_i1.p1  ORF type:complete len:572 (+),score=89.14 TRINITY_DN24453_c0_g1_i1:108-1823(+)
MAQSATAPDGREGELVFCTFQGERVELLEEPTSVAQARCFLATALGLKYSSQILMLLESGEELADGMDLPVMGHLQVQTLPPPEHTWPRIMWDAKGFDEGALREALDNAFPPQLLSKIDFSIDAPNDWRPMDFWSEDETWARWVSAKMRQATTRAVGTWADYWRFADLADTYGYWMVEGPYRSKEKTVDLIVANVKHWIGLLEDLDTTFRALQKRTRGMTNAETWELAAAELLKYSPRFHTDTSFKYGFETWYLPFVQTLEWFADYNDMSVEPRSFVAGETNVRDGLFMNILTPWGNGIFGSYSVKADGAALFARKMAEHHGIAYEDFDATSRWLETRNGLASLGRGCTSEVMPCSSDAHFQYICSVDHSRCAVRAERMKEALHMVRSDAKQQLELTATLITRWQAAVLGMPGLTSFREADAYAKEGRERYPHSMLDKFSERIEEARLAEVAPEVRAVRAYLDVCFFHPFEDGNGRLARLVLDFILTKEGLCLRDIGGLFFVARRADDRVGTAAFIETVQQYLAPIGPECDAALEEWSAKLRNSELLTPAAKKPGYNWFDCVCSDIDLDRD